MLDPRGEALHTPLLQWYAAAARDLPWRRPGCSPWGVLVSEIMLQQTPVARVLPIWTRWMTLWPTPSALAGESPGEAVREWGRLGYPRRALRLHAAATVLRDEHGDEVPSDAATLRTLPGIGDYTAAAVAAFAFGQRATVVDTNVRRVQARAVTGVALPAPSMTRTEVELATSLLPDSDADAATWNVAVMELGALVCTARSPRCEECPVAALCSWRLAGSPPHAGPPRRGQAWEGTDRQCRGRMLQALREADGPLTGAALQALWPHQAQQGRCLDTLVHDGLVEPLGGDRFQLPS
jgi:A/G-specific adenine glycosylase